MHVCFVNNFRDGKFSVSKNKYASILVWILYKSPASFPRGFLRVFSIFGFVCCHCAGAVLFKTVYCVSKKNVATEQFKIAAKAVNQLCHKQTTTRPIRIFFFLQNFLSHLSGGGWAIYNKK
jgi:hypothetical protein